VRTRLTPTLIAILTAMVLALGLITPAMAQAEDTIESTSLKAGGRDSVALAAAKSVRKGELAIHHGPVEVILADTGSDGHQPGDLRVTSAATADADGEPLGRLDATLTTTVVDVPAEDDETRIGVLVFTIGDSGEHQVVVQGRAHYPAQGSTIATGDTTVRPIVGGSGLFAGAAGSAVTEHFADGSWVHTLEFHRSTADALVERAVKQGTREGLIQWRVERKAAQAGRKEARDEREAGRKGARDTRKAEREGDDTEVAADSTEAGAAIDQLYTDAAADQTGVVRTDLGVAEPLSAPGEELGLWQYVIAAGEELAPHTHPGWQLARITAGDLEYSVISGEGVLLRADGSSEPMGPGTYVLATGDGVIENPELEHFGANRGEDVVTLISATLFEAGEPIATVIEDAPAE
jgi:hypothetical protein